MSGARDEILGRVRAALADAPSAPTVPRGYRSDGKAEGLLDLFVERVADYRRSS